MQGLLGLGLRARQVVVGVAQVRAAAQRGRLALAVVASDAAPNSAGKVVPLLNARRISVIRSLTAAELGEVTGRETTAAVGVVDPNLAGGILAAQGGDGMGV